MPDYPIVEPAEIVQLVEAFVESEHRDAAKYANRTPLDDSGVFTLHRLAAEIYAAGYRDGERAESARRHGERRRERDRNAAATPDTDG